MAPHEESEESLEFKRVPPGLLWMRPEIVIGLTGAFGSGCTTAAKHLRDGRSFDLIRLSDVVRKKWADAGRSDPSRLDLQRLGDELRQDHGPGALVDIALSSAAEGSSDDHGRLVIDGIRNLGEVARLRDLFGHRFTLVAVLARPEDRWDRISTSQYTDLGFTEDDFVSDDARDRNEEVAYGQQVELCIDVGDVLLNNDGDVTLADFKAKVLAYIDLISGQSIRHASKEEIKMHMAYSSAHSSKCIKRHVGAVITDQRGEVMGVGYNENPLGTHPCIEEPVYGYSCFRDIIRNEHFAALADEQTRCPTCGDILEKLVGPPWRCPSCSEKGIKTNLEVLFFPDRAMNWCTAIHAEDRAIRSAGDRAQDGILYTTTFPCFQCAEKITEAGLRKIVFTEAYPDPHSAERLELAGIEFTQFEGVRSSAFERIFSKVNPK